MAQLGGMISGCEIKLNEEGHFYRVTYDLDGDNDFLITHMKYDSEEEEIWINEEYYNFNEENKFEEFNKFIEENKHKFKKIK